MGQQFMRAFQNLSIRVKALVAVGLMLTAVIGLRVQVLQAMQAVNGGLAAIAMSDLPKQRAAREISRDSNNLHANLLRYAASAQNGTNTGPSSMLARNVQSEIARLEGSVAAFAARTDLSEEEHQQVANIANNWSFYSRLARDAIEIGSKDAVLATMMLGGADDSYRALSREMQAMSSLFAQHTEATLASLRAQTSADYTSLVLVGSTGILFILLIAVFVGRSIVGPVREVTVAMRAVGSGHQHKIALRADRLDEVGEMVRAVTAFQEKIERREDALRVQNMRFDAALNGMSQGLCLVDKDERLIVCNKVYQDLYRLPDEMTRAGTQLADIFQYRIDQGFYAQGTTLTSMIETNRARSRCGADEVCTSLVELTDGRTIRIAHRPMEDGSYVATHEDITGLLTAQKEFAQQNYRFQLLTNGMAEGLCMFDAESRMIMCNEPYLRLYGLSDEEINPGITSRELMKRIAVATGTDPRKLIQQRQDVVETAKASMFTRELGDGRVISIHHMPMDGGGWVATHEDLTDTLRMQQEIETQNYRFQLLIDGMAQGLVMFDPEQRLILCNSRYARLFNLPAELTRPGTTLKQIRAWRVEHGSAPAGGDAVKLQFMNENRRATTGGKPHHYTVDLEDGRALAVRHMPMQGGGWVATLEDITEQRRSEAQIAHMARHDALTDLPNRILFREQMEDSIARVRRSKHREGLAVLCLDLDHFKEVNDTLGHPMGDALLKAVTERLRDTVRETDMVARLGGDEFAILQAGLKQPSAAATLASRLNDALKKPFHLDGNQVVVGVSIGISIAPQDGTDADQLLKNADMALYRAKGDGRGTFRFFEAEMDANAQRRRALERDLRDAIVKNEFELHYQPLVSTEDGSVLGFEALIRWNSPDRGMVSPATFIPLAEETGLIVPIGEWVLRTACQEAVRWPEHIKVAVNLSATQFKSANLLEMVTEALKTSGLMPSRLEVEITEGVLLQNSEATLATLHQMRGLGIGIAMDDFGTGYSSLSYLRSFPFDKIKIDRSFVKDLGDREDCAAIVRAVTGLGSNLGMATVAEGVETADQLEALRQQGCTQVQGFLFSPPVPAAWVPRLLAPVDLPLDPTRNVA